MNIDWSEMQTAEALAAERSLLGYRSWKLEREEKVRAIVVEVDGLRFDGDEDSQNCMARAVAAADLMTETTEWTLADNTVATVSMQTLKTACRLAGEEQTRIWNEGRPA
ncbi:DUF4376 domain-containing protein [Aeromonas salmonicida]|uniref:DUF4376 domain-containing protein n=1 Tax=Aeromonas salmonicida TaxID=645 RepID=UPI003CFD8224